LQRVKEVPKIRIIAVGECQERDKDYNSEADHNNCNDQSCPFNHEGGIGFAVNLSDDITDN
jgi:hypothetical protein